MLENVQQSLAVRMGNFSTKTQKAVARGIKVGLVLGGLLGLVTSIATGEILVAPFVAALYGAIGAALCGTVAGLGGMTAGAFGEVNTTPVEASPYPGMDQPGAVNPTPYRSRTAVQERDVQALPAGVRASARDAVDPQVARLAALNAQTADAPPQNWQDRPNTRELVSSGRV